VAKCKTETIEETKQTEFTASVRRSPAVDFFFWKFIAVYSSEPYPRLTIRQFLLQELAQPVWHSQTNMVTIGLILKCFMARKLPCTAYEQYN